MTAQAATATATKAQRGEDTKDFSGVRMAKMKSSGRLLGGDVKIAFEQDFFQTDDVKDANTAIR
jgi:hypothetical protein